MTAAKRRTSSCNVSGTDEPYQTPDPPPYQSPHYQHQGAGHAPYRHRHQPQSHSPQSHYQHQQPQQQQQQQQQQQHQQPLRTTGHHVWRDCSVKLPLDILWLPKSAMRPVGPDTAHTDCILVVGVSRPKLAVVFLTVMLISLFLTFHVLYDSAVYNMQAAQAVVSEHNRLALLSSGGNRLPEFRRAPASAMNQPALAAASIESTNQISHPMVFPSNRVHFPKTSRRLPQALIIGIRKCGTRALLEMLYLHPRIQKAGGEVHFFDRDENYLKGLEWYRKKMPHSFRGQITIEKSPSYFVSPEVPERVRAMNASIKLLLIVREPVTRAISDYTQLRSHAATATSPLAPDGSFVSASAPSAPAAAIAPAAAAVPGTGSGFGLSGGPKQRSLPSASGAGPSLLYSRLSKGDGYSSAQVYDNSLGGGGGGSGAGAGTGRRIAAAYGNRNFAQAYTTTPSPAALAAQMAAKRFEELAIFPNGTVNESYRPLTISMYHLHLHRWLEVFPREQLLVVNGDRLIEDPVSQLKRIETFLGIEHRVTSSHFYFNETKGFYCLRYDSGDRCLRETKGRKHPHVDPMVISKLRKFFAEHNQRFYELVGEDLGWPEDYMLCWCFCVASQRQRYIAGNAEKSP